ncbi:MAG TPA: alpha/beta fold hydrolase, partial [Acidimicrobiales bacterium]|nr:alpha/beta fold hydrolase [Acidimicrobiales bacterium]
YVVEGGAGGLFVRDLGEGPPVLLLHGWPDTGALFDEVVGRLVRSGRRCLAPDLRGCGRSAKPTELERYAMAELVTDVVAVIEAAGAGPVTLVGHDWGAALAWVVATYRPDLVASLVAVSVGHPSAFRSGGFDQLRRSWYTLLFQFEGLGEAVLRQDDYAVLRRWFAHPRADEVVAELERDGQITTHLLWYRANLPPDAFTRPAPVLEPVEVPVVGVWSSGDPALTEAQMRESGAHCASGFRYSRLEGVGHWVPYEAPAALAALVLEGT